MENDKYKCPKCGSDNTSSISLMIKMGKNSSTTTKKEMVGFNVEKQRIDYENGFRETHLTDIKPVFDNVTHQSESTSDFIKEIVADFNKNAKRPAEPQEPYLYAKPDSFGISNILGSMLNSVVPAAFIYFFLWIFVDDENARHTYGILVFIALVILLCLDEKSRCKNRLKNYYIDKENYEEQVKLYPEKLKTYEKELAEYNQKVYDFEHSNICMRCGEIFVVRDEK